MTVTIERAQGVGTLDRGGVAAEAVGLEAIADRWIPRGSFRCYATSPYEADHGQIVRTSTEISVRLDHLLSPRLSVTSLSEGRVRVAIETFWPVGGLVMTGTLTRQGDVVTFADEDSDRVVEMRRGADGRLSMRVRQSGKESDYALLF